MMVIRRFSAFPFSGVCKCPNFAHHSILGDISSNRYVLENDVKQIPKIGHWTFTKPFTSCLRLLPRTSSQEPQNGQGIHPRTTSSVPWPTFLEENRGLPAGNVSYWTWPSKNSEFSDEKWWFSSQLCLFIRGEHPTKKTGEWHWV